MATTICLCMIVKNESKIITRCLDSAKPVIDYVSICDTGSTDGTPEIIREWLEKNGIKGKVHSEPFKNFGYNRTRSYQLAQETYPDVTYLLLLDADMVLEVKPGFQKSALTKDKYTIIQYNTCIRYPNIRLIRSRMAWECIGCTHEYVDVPDVKLSDGQLDTLVIDDREDGGCKSDKFVRDERLLKEGLADPETKPHLRTRYLFYLAETLKNLNKNQEAITYYKKRIESGGWYEEIYYSMLKIGDCYRCLASDVTGEVKKRDEVLKGIKEKISTLESMGSDTVGKIKELLDSLQTQLTEVKEKEDTYLALAQYYYLKAWEFRPGRAESLYHLVEMLRLQGRNSLALTYAMIGKEIPYPKNDSLFIDYRVYEYLFDFEISIVAYYIEDKRQLGRSATRRLLKRKDLPEWYRATVSRNAKFYELEEK